MFSATESKELRFHFLHKRNGALNPIGYDKVDKETGDLVPEDEIVRGFRVREGQLRRADDRAPRIRRENEEAAQEASRA